MSSQAAAIDVGKGLIRAFGGRNARNQIRLVLGHLLGDLGMDCSDSACSVDTSARSGTLNPEVLRILMLSGLYREGLFLAGSEKRARNRGSARLKKTDHPSLSVRDGRIYYKNDEGKQVFIADGNEGRRGVIIPHCAAIMAAHYDWVFGKIDQRFKAPRIVIVDFSRLREELTVTTGAEMSLRVFKKTTGDHHFVNVFFANDQGDHRIIQKTSWDEFDD